MPDRADSSDLSEYTPTADGEHQPTDPPTLIAVCTLNEADNVGNMIGQLRRAIPHAQVLIVDDDSPDGTAELATEMANRDPQVHVEVRRNQRGLGGAIRHAMQYAVDHDYQYFLNLDGDLSHDPQQLPRLLERAIRDPPVDVVIGSRYVSGGRVVGWPLHRKLMSRMVNRFATLCLRLPVSDCSGSMRCYRVSALRQIGMENIRNQGYAVLEEVLLLLDRQNAAMAEVPITFTDRQLGKSKLTPREAIRSVWQMVKLGFRRGA